MLHKKIIKRIPGHIPEPSPREKQGYIEDLGLKTRAELLELIERQDKLLANKSFILKLPDKGARISKFRSHLAEELSQRDEVEKTCELLSGLNIGKSSGVDEIEWTGKYSHAASETQLLDSDDDSDEERNPFKILATQSGVCAYQKQLKIEELEESLIKPEDLKDFDINVTNGNPGSEPEGDAYVKHLCDKLEKPREKKKVFKPHHTLKKTSNGQSANSQQSKKPLGPHWEVTAATPPPPIHGDLKLISLHESLHLQKEQAEKYKDIQAKHAAEKLASQFGVKMGTTLPDTTQRLMYRDEPNHIDSSSGSEDEMATSEGEQDDEEPEKDGAVVYNIVD